MITYTVSDGEDTSTATLTVTVGADVNAPVVAKPTVAFGKGRVNETAPLRISWSAFDAGVGVKSYQVQVSVAGGPWKAVYTGPKTSVTKFYPFRKSLVWRVRATDKEGNTSGWVSSAKRKIAAIQNSNPSSSTPGTGTASSCARPPAAATPSRARQGQPRGRDLQRAGPLYVGPQDEALGLREGLRRRRAHRPLQAPQRVARQRQHRDPVQLGGQRSPPDQDRQRHQRVRTNFDAFIVLK